MWGPQYRGVTGHFKKAVEIVNLPWNVCRIRHHII